jgi:hypothetical protein
MTRMEMSSTTWMTCCWCNRQQRLLPGWPTPTPPRLTPESLSFHLPHPGGSAPLTGCRPRAIDRDVPGGRHDNPSACCSEGKPANLGSGCWRACAITCWCQTQLTGWISRAIGRRRALRTASEQIAELSVALAGHRPGQDGTPLPAYPKYALMVEFMAYTGPHASEVVGVSSPHKHRSLLPDIVVSAATGARPVATGRAILLPLRNVPFHPIYHQRHARVGSVHSGGDRRPDALRPTSPDRGGTQPWCRCRDRAISRRARCNRFDPGLILIATRSLRRR